MAAKLSQREKNLLMLCVGVLVLMALAIVANGFMGRRKIALEKITTLQRQKQENDTWIKDRAFWEKRRAWLAEKMPTTESLGRAQGQLLEDLQNEALELGIVTEQPTLPPLATPTDSHREVTVSVRLRGDQSIVLQWLSTLQSPEKFQAVRQLELEIDTKAREKTPQVVCTLTLARWFKHESGILTHDYSAMKTLLSLLCLVLSQGMLFAVEPDPDLPQPFDPASLSPVTASSPFTRMVSISDNLVLTGIAYINGKPVATLFNKETKESHIVSSEPNFQGWVLNEALPAPDITRSRAVVTIGGEQVKVSYAAITAEDMKMDRKREKSDGGGGGPPGGGDRYKGSSRGPSDEDRKKYESLSEKSKEKFRDMMRSKFSDEKFRNAPEEERRNVIRKEFERIEKEDKGGK